MINLKTKLYLFKIEIMIETTKLEDNKTVVFKSPIQGTDVLVRTGNNKKSLSFFQAVLRSCSKKYGSMSTEDKITFLENFQKDITSKVDCKTWEKINGMTSKLSFKEITNDILLNCYLFLEDNPKAKGKSKWSEEELEVVTNTLKKYKTLALKSIRHFLSSKHSIEISEGVLGKMRREL
jgi:hypothetical protein